MKKIFAASFLIAACFSSISTDAAEQATVSDNRVNVRGQAKLYSEVITQLKKGDQVTVLERIPVQNPKPGEPASWAKIKLPPNTTVWVFAPMVKDGAVRGSRLNLRAGPGENYSVLGRINKGTQVTEIRTVEDWMEIEPPAEAFAFVDSRLLKPAEGTAVASNEGTTPAEPAPAAATPAETAKTDDVAIPATTTAATTAAAANTPEPKQPEPAAEEAKLETATLANEGDSVAKTQDVAVPAKQAAPKQTSAATAPATAAATQAIPRQAPPQPAATVPDLALHLPKTAPEPEQKEQEKEKRIVRREGIVKGTVSIQAPTYFELENELTGKAVNYLHAEKSGVKLKDFKKQKVVITGEEYIDPRWPKTPVIEIETLEPVQ